MTYHGKERQNTLFIQPYPNFFCYICIIGKFTHNEEYYNYNFRGSCPRVWGGCYGR